MHVDWGAHISCRGEARNPTSEGVEGTTSYHVVWDRCDNSCRVVKNLSLTLKENKADQENEL